MSTEYVYNFALNILRRDNCEIRYDAKYSTGYPYHLTYPDYAQGVYSVSGEELMDVFEKCNDEAVRTRIMIAILGSHAQD